MRPPTCPRLLDTIDVAAAAAGGVTLNFNDNANISLSSDVNAGGLTIDADDDGATSYLKGSVTISLDADVDAGAVIVDASGATDDGFDNIALVVNVDNTTTGGGFDLQTGTGVVTASGAKELFLAATSTAKSLDASAMTGKVTVNYDNTNDIATVTTGSGADAIVNATTAIGTKATIKTMGGNDTITMLTQAKADINGGDGYDKVNIVGDITALTFAEVEELATTGDITSAKASQVSGASTIMSGANAFTFGTAAANFDNEVIDLSSLSINGVTGFTADVSNGLSTALYTSATGVVLTGSSVADTLKGTANADTVTGGDGVDKITGNAGADTIDGGKGGDVIYGDNDGTARVETYTVTTAGAGTATVVIGGDTITATYATTGDAVIAALNTAAQSAAGYGELYTTAVTLNTGTTTDDVLTITYLVDGNNVGSATTSATTLVVNTTGTNGTGVGGTQVTAGTAGTSSADVITGGAGTDIFVFGKGDGGAAPSATAHDTITDFATASDTIEFTDAALTIVTNATASAGTAKITSAGIATFNSADDTLVEMITAVEAGIATGTATAGQTALFQFGDDAYMFISDGTDNVDANDTLIELQGIDLTSTAFDTLTLSAGNATIA